MSPDPAYIFSPHPESSMTDSDVNAMWLQSNGSLSEIERRVRLMLDSAAEAICACDSTGKCLFANCSAARILGYDDPAELLGKNLHLLEHHSRKDGTPYPIEECPIYLGFQTGQSVHRDDEVYWRKDNTSFPVEYWSHPVIQDGQTIGAVITFFDIAERKQIEEALRRSEEQNRSLLQINNAIITNLTEEALLRSISEALRRFIGFDRCAITLYQPEKDSFRFLAVEGEMTSDYFHTGMETPRTETSIGWAYDNRKPRICGDLQPSSPFANEQRLAAEGLRSICVLPMILQGQCIGTLSFVSREPDRYSQQDAMFLQEVANQVVLAIRNMKSYDEIASLKARLEKENVYLREELRAEHNFEEIVGNSPALLSVLRAVEQVAPTDSTVLICGETGTGKELVARAIHSRSTRSSRALVNVNCSAISAGLVESELFGHVKGAFTGAIDRRVGRFELANAGTIFLDEIGELSMETQVKLLRVLQEQEFEPVGSSRTVKIDVRGIAATNRNLREAVDAGRFRADLYYRLNVFPIELPPLRERRSDIPKLVAFNLSRLSKRFGRKIEGFSKQSVDHLLNYSWPGNIRELQNVIERAAIVCSGPILCLGPDLTPLTGYDEGAPRTDPLSITPDPNSELPTLEEVQRKHILAALHKAGGKIEGRNGAAEILNIHPNTLRHRISKLGIRTTPSRPS